MLNFSYENEFDLHENGRVGETNRLVLTQRQTRTRKWAIMPAYVPRAVNDGLDSDASQICWQVRTVQIQASHARK